MRVITRLNRTSASLPDTKADGGARAELKITGCHPLAGAFRDFLFFAFLSFVLGANDEAKCLCINVLLTPANESNRPCKVYRVARLARVT